jgi:hypothetical protein
MWSSFYNNCQQNDSEFPHICPPVFETKYITNAQGYIAAISRNNGCHGNATILFLLIAFGVDVANNAI